MRNSGRFTSSNLYFYIREGVERSGVLLGTRQEDGAGSTVLHGEQLQRPCVPDGTIRTDDDESIFLTFKTCKIEVITDQCSAFDLIKKMEVLAAGIVLDFSFH